MKFNNTIFFTALATAGAVSAGCNHDNCERAIGGTFRGQATQAARLSDCNRILAATVTPDPTTTTVTVTATPAVVLPAYASVCSGYAHYSSGCACFGATGAIVTAPTPTYTQTVTVTKA